MIVDDRRLLRSGPVGVVVAIVVCVLWSAPAMTEDFATQSEEWHGLSDFVELLEVQQRDVREVQRLEWADVDADDAIIIVYPDEELDVDSLASFVVDGGRVMLADDFGASGSLLERLNLDRRTPEPDELPHDDFVDDHRGWPRFDVGGGHPMIDGVDEVVANYPAVLDNVGGPVIGYGEDGGLVYDMELGEGRAVVVADPGIFINAMMGAADNRRLAFNTAQHICGDDEDCRIWLLIEDIEFSGAYHTGDSADPGGIAEQVADFNEELREAFQKLPETRFLYFAAIFVILGTAVYLVTVFPWRRARRLSSYIDRRRRKLSGPLTEFDWNVRRFVEPDGRINHALPMAIFKESFEDVLYGALDLERVPKTGRPSSGVLAKRLEERYLSNETPEVRRRRRRQIKELLERLEAVPDRHRVFLESEDYYSARDLEQLHNGVVEVLDWMGLQDDYERRTRNIYDRHLRTRR